MSEFGYPNPEADKSNATSPDARAANPRSIIDELRDRASERELSGIVYELTRRAGVQVDAPAAYPVKVGARIRGEDWHAEVLASDYRTGKHPDDCVLELRVRKSQQPDFFLRVTTSDATDAYKGNTPTLVVESLERKSLATSLGLYTS